MRLRKTDSQLYVNLAKPSAIPAVGEARSFLLGALFCAACALSFLAAPSHARSGWAVETDPATFILDGYSLHGRYSPESRPQWRVGVGVYSLEFPEALIDIASANRDEGWELDLERGIGFFAERYFNETNTGWFTGLQVADHQFELANPDLAPGDTERYGNVLVMPYGGYLYDFSPSVYVQAWAGAGYTSKIRGSNTLAGAEYDIPPVFTFAALHLGYRF